MSLDISINKLQKIDLSWLRSDQANPHSLEYINLSNNNLTELNLNPLMNCSKLKFLDITGNNLEKIDLSPLRFCKNLKTLLIDNTDLIVWKNTKLNSKELPKGLKKYRRKIKHSWKEYNKEIERFMKEEPVIEERLNKSKWLKSLEDEKDFRINKVFFTLRPLYYEVRNCFIYECYRGTIALVSSLMEAYFTHYLPFEDMKTQEKLLKRNNQHEVDPLRLSLSRLAEVASNKEYISSDLYDRIYMFLPVRHNIMHYPGSTSQLGFYRKSIRGSGTKGRSVSFESPNRRPILPLSPKEAAEEGIIIFLNIVKEFNSLK